MRARPDPLQPLYAEIALEPLKSPLQDLDGATVLTHPEQDLAERTADKNAEIERSQTRCDVVRPLNMFHGLVEIAGLENVVGEEGERPPEPGSVVESGRERLGFLQDADEAAKLGETEQGCPQIKPDIDRLLVLLATGGQMIDGGEHLIVPGQRLAVRRLGARLQPGLP
jgi:hypothetical protein